MASSGGPHRLWGGCHRQLHEYGITASRCSQTLPRSPVPPQALDNRGPRAFVANLLVDFLV